MWVSGDYLPAWAFHKGERALIRFRFPCDGPFDGSRPTTLSDAVNYIRDRHKDVRLSASAVGSFDPDEGEKEDDRAGRYVPYLIAKQSIEDAAQLRPGIEVAKLHAEWRRLHSKFLAGVPFGDVPKVLGWIPGSFAETLEDGMFRQAEIAKFIKWHIYDETAGPLIAGGRRFWTLQQAAQRLREVAGLSEYEAERTEGEALKAARSGLLETVIYPTGGVIKVNRAAGIGRLQTQGEVFGEVPVYCFRDQFNTWLNTRPDLTTHFLPEDGESERIKVGEEVQSPDACTNTETSVTSQNERADGAAPLPTPVIAALFGKDGDDGGIKWSDDQWKKNLADGRVRWLSECRAARGEVGGAPATWWPLLIADKLAAKGSPVSEIKACFTRCSRVDVVAAWLPAVEGWATERQQRAAFGL